MGDRANVHVVDDWDTNGVFLYSHWQGTEMPENLRLALARGVRWSDTQYLTRIIFDQLTAGRQGEETGAGISARVGDGESRVARVDATAGTVTLTAYGVSKSWTFREYVSLDHAAWPGE